MALPAVIPEDKLQALEQVGTAEIVIGIPSYNHVETIGTVVQAVQAGLRTCFPARKSVIIHSDGGSTDGTSERVLGAASEDIVLFQVPYPAYPVQKFTLPYHGIPGKENALQIFFQLSQKLEAKVCAVIAPDLRNISPEWVEALIRPILEKGFALVTPCYVRPKYDGTITSGIVYPLIRALYGKRIRDPLGGDVAFSQSLMGHYLKQNSWDSEVARVGIEMWATTEAICNSFSICQAWLGPKLHPSADSSTDVSDMLAQILGALFLEMERKAGFWQKTRASEAVPIWGTRVEAVPNHASVDTNRMIAAFQLGYQTLQEIWGLVLPPATMLELKKLATRPQKEFWLTDAIWARTVYDFALGHRLHVINRDHLLRSLTPLYLGWIASLVLQTRSSHPQDVEDRIEKLCLEYESQKPYLISRWRWPDRFNP